MFGITPGVELGDGVGLLRLGDTLVALWSKPASSERWAFQLQHIEAACSEAADGILMLLVMPAVEAPPNDVVRAEMQAALRGLGAKVRRLVAVPLGNSLWLSVVRTTVRGLFVASGQARHRVAGSVSEGVSQLLEKAGPVSPTVDDLLRGIETLSLALGTKDSLPPAGPPPH